jgi:carboxyl-terminal processing protease
MILRSTALLLGLTLGALSPAALPLPQDLGTALTGRLEAAADAPLEELWEQALGLRDLAEDPAELDAALDAALGDSAALSPRGVLLAAACRLLSDDLAESGAVAPLRTLSASDDPEIARAALELLARPELRSALDRETRDALVTDLVETAGDADRAPRVRLAAARAAHALGGGRQKAAARREMLAYLDSDDPGLRALGALSLASVGEPVQGRLLDELERLAALPGKRGSLASAYIKQEDIRRTRQDKITRLLREQERMIRGQDREGIPDELRPFSAVMGMVRGMHLDGEAYTDEELVNEGLSGMLRSLDEHSSYLPAEAFARMDQELGGEYGGIGAFVAVDTLGDGLFTITRPIYSGPAYGAGLTSDDKIVRIDEWPTHVRGESHDIEDIVKRLKGKPGTTVRLYVWRRGMDPELIENPTEDMAVDIERGRIEIPAVQWQMLPGGVGLVSLTTFSTNAAAEVARAIRELEGKGMQALLLDLRMNGGGLLTQAVAVADLFLPEGLVVVSTATRFETAEVHRTRHDPFIDPDTPLVVLVNRYSASASEIVSGALQDHGRAVLVGDRTFGKGSVQQLLPVDGYQDEPFQDENRNRRFDEYESYEDTNGDGEYTFAPRVKMTIAEYLLPTGRSIHRKRGPGGEILTQGGVEPDLPVSAQRIEAWRWEERQRIRAERLDRAYVEEHWEENADLFRELALYDGRDPDRYPEFDAFHASLDTPLPADDVRRMLRAEMRRRVQDERGAEFPFGDFQEDVQVQAAVESALESLGRAIDDVEEYFVTFVDRGEEADRAPLLARTAPAGIAEARERLAAARSGEVELTAEDYESLMAILSELDR